MNRIYISYTVKIKIIISNNPTDRSIKKYSSTSASYEFNKTFEAAGIFV